MSEDIPYWYRRDRLRRAASKLLALVSVCPELFERVLPIDDDTMQTLREIAIGDDDHAAN